MTKVIQAMKDAIREMGALGSGRNYQRVSNDTSLALVAQFPPEELRILNDAITQALNAAQARAMTKESSTRQAEADLTTLASGQRLGPDATNNARIVEHAFRAIENRLKEVERKLAVAHLPRQCQAPHPGGVQHQYCMMDAGHPFEHTNGHSAWSNGAWRSTCGDKMQSGISTMSVCGRPFGHVGVCSDWKREWENYAREPVTIAYTYERAVPDGGARELRDRLLTCRAIARIVVRDLVKAGYNPGSAQDALDALQNIVQNYRLPPLDPSKT